MFACFVSPLAASEPSISVYSPGQTTYYINPVTGADSHSGLSEDAAWKSFARVNEMRFACGDRLEIAPGTFDQTLRIAGGGRRRSAIECEG